MKNSIMTCILAAGLAAGASVSAAEDGHANLLRAITLCPAGSNPLDALKQLKGDIFVKVEAHAALDGPTTISADVWSSPSLRNLSIMAPDALLGHLVLEMGYENKAFDRPLYCKMAVRPRQRHRPDVFPRPGK